VYISERTDESIPQLEEVRELVRRDWEQNHRKDLVERFYLELIKKYDIAIEWPATVAEEP
jgi:hypothetical protein